MTQYSNLANLISTNTLIQELGTNKNKYHNKSINDINSEVKISSKFAFFKSENFQLVELASGAEYCVESDPDISIIRIGQFAELLAQQIAKQKGLNIKYDEKQSDLIQKLENNGFINSQNSNYFHLIRQTRNKAVHFPFEANSKIAHKLLKYAEILGRWYYEEFGQYSLVDNPLDPNPIFWQCKTTVAQLETVLANYDFLNNQLQDLPNLIRDLHNKKKNIEAQIYALKNKSQQRRDREKYQYEIEKQQLLERKNNRLYRT